MGRNRCNNGVWAAQRFNRLRSTIAATGSAPRPRRRRRAPRRARTGSSAARTSPRTPPNGRSRGIWAGASSRVRSARPSARIWGGNIPAGQEEYKFATNGAKCATKAKGQECSWNKPCCGATEWPRAEKVASAKRQVHHNEKVQASQRGVQVASDWRQVLLGKVRQRPLRADE